MMTDTTEAEQVAELMGLGNADLRKPPEEEVKADGKAKTALIAEAEALLKDTAGLQAMFQNMVRDAGFDEISECGLSTRQAVDTIGIYLYPLLEIMKHGSGTGKLGDIGSLVYDYATWHDSTPGGCEAIIRAYTKPGQYAEPCAHIVNMVQSVSLLLGVEEALNLNDEHGLAYALNVARDMVVARLSKPGERERG